MPEPDLVRLECGDEDDGIVLVLVLLPLLPVPPAFKALALVLWRKK